MRKLGYTANRGNSFKGLKDYLIENNIDFSHFLGRAHLIIPNILWKI